MKKRLLPVLFLLLTMVVQAGIVKHTYTFDAPQWADRGEYSMALMDNTIQSALAGQPSLPWYAVKLMLPPGESATSVEIIYENEIPVAGSRQLFPYQPSRPLSESNSVTFSKDEKMYRSTDPYPDHRSARVSTHFMNGYGLAFTHFSPIRVIPATGEISYYGQVTVVVHTAPQAKAGQALHMITPHADITARVSSLSDNPEMTSAYSSRTTLDENAYELLIITPQQFADSFTELTDVYFNRGIKSQVTSTETIGQESTGNDLQEKIRNYIIDQYQTNGIRFVLLGGDVEFVPYRGFSCYVQSGGGYQDDGIPADLYYAALDGTWNDNNNNLWGEPDEDDLLPDIAVGRFPFSNPDELQSLIHKSHYYQNFPVTGELTNALMAGENLYNNPITWGSDYLELLIGERDDNGYTTIGIPEDYNFEKLYEVNQSWSKYDLMNAINSGKQFVHHVGHAAQTYVAYMTNSDITNSNFSGANGVDHNYTLLQTHGCDCGAFDINDCILERMVNIDNFAVAVNGNSRFGWFNEGQTEGPAAHLHREMTDALYNEQIRFLGEAFTESKIQTAPWVEAPGQWEEGALRWNFYDLNTLGDPALSVWTNEPAALSVTYDTEPVIGITEMQITVTADGQPAAAFTCALIKDGVMIGSGLTDNTGLAVIHFDVAVSQPGEATLTVAGRNALPGEYPVQFIPGNGAYVVFSEVAVNDSNGNNNQQPDYGEDILLTITLGNVGLGDATDVEVSLTTADPMVTITDGYENYGPITAGGQTSVTDAFAVSIHDSIPDMHTIAFELTCTSGSQSWSSSFGLIALAPQPELLSLTVSDVTGGNSSFTLDPGESDTLWTSFINQGHSISPDAILHISTTSPWVSLATSSTNVGAMAIDDVMQSPTAVLVDAATPIGTIVAFDVELTAGAYHAQRTWYLPVGLLMEDFETGDLSRFEWETGGALPWIVNGTAPYEGLWSAQSGAIDDLQSSSLQISINVLSNDQISFYRKVSSEVNYDYLRFYVNGAKLGEWSGEQDWQQQTYDLNAGTYLLKWVYEKDINTTGGDDAAWLDNIVFPSTATILGVQQSVNTSDIRLWPNPAHDRLTLVTGHPADISVTVYDLRGAQYGPVLKFGSPDGQVVIHTSGWSPGMYLLLIDDGQSSQRQKVLIR